MELVAQLGRRFPTKFLLDVRVDPSRVSIRDVRPLDLVEPRKEPDEQLLKLIDFVLVTPATFIERYIAVDVATNADGFSPIVLHIDFGVLDPLTFEFGMHFIVVPQKNAIHHVLPDAPERTVIVDDEEAGPDRHPLMVLRSSPNRGTLATRDVGSGQRGRCSQ